MFLKNRNICSKIKRSKVTDYAALTKLAKISKIPLVFYRFIITSRYFFSKFSVMLRQNLELIFNKEPFIWARSCFCKDMDITGTIWHIMKETWSFINQFFAKLRQRAFFSSSVSIFHMYFGYKRVTFMIQALLAWPFFFHFCQFLTPWWHRAWPFSFIFCQFLMSHIVRKRELVVFEHQSHRPDCACAQSDLCRC